VSQLFVTVASSGDQVAAILIGTATGNAVRSIGRIPRSSILLTLDL
jgi:hypothetical protein